jgi:hypothetical protein
LGIRIKNILHIDFIGKSITEIHLYEDYIEEFKKIMLSKPTLKISFINLDPLDHSLLKKKLSDNKIRLAAEMYLKRLNKRLATTPFTAHKKWLKSEIERATVVTRTCPNVTSRAPSDTADNENIETIQTDSKVKNVKGNQVTTNIDNINGQTEDVEMLDASCIATECNEEDISSQLVATSLENSQQ